MRLKLKFWNRKTKPKTMSPEQVIEIYKQGAQDLAASYDSIEFNERMRRYLKERFNIQEK